MTRDNVHKSLSRTSTRNSVHQMRRTNCNWHQTRHAEIPDAICSFSSKWLDHRKRVRRKIPVLNRVNIWQSKLHLCKKSLGYTSMYRDHRKRKKLKRAHFNSLFMLTLSMTTPFGNHPIRNYTYERRNLGSMGPHTSQIGLFQHRKRGVGNQSIL